MDLNVACGVALGVSLFFIVLAVVAGVLLHRAELKSSGLQGSRRILTPFQVFLLCFFFAAVSIFFPIYYVDYFVAETGFLKVVESFLLAVQNVLRLITLNGEFNNIRDFLTDGARVNAVLGAIYSIYAAIVFVAAPLLTAGFVLSFFRGASALLRYSLRPCRELYVFSELNERSLALAKNILSERTRGRVVVFADVFERGEEQSYELVFSARRMGAICVRKDVTDLGLKYARKCERKIYLIGIDEDENIGQALKLINRHRGTKYDNNRMQFYVFSITAESEALLDSIDNGDMKVRRINENRNLALTEMREHSIFANAIPTDGKKQIRIAIVGMGGYGRELMKMICCLGQMPGYAVEVHLFDKEGDASERVRALAPEFASFSGVKIEGEAEYDLVFHAPADVKSAQFAEELASIGGLTGVYVTLGEDELNIETAIRIRTALKRRAPENEVPIYAVVFSATKSGIMERGGIKNMEGKNYNITLIGSLPACYSIQNIEQAELEESALELHTYWANTEAEKENDKQTFEHYEYYRRSAMMQAIYRKMRDGLGFVRADETTPSGRANNDMLRLYEHRRWNTYMRGEGYVWGAVKDHMAKTHPLLVPFDALPEPEKRKDDF